MGGRSGKARTIVLVLLALGGLIVLCCGGIGGGATWAFLEKGRNTEPYVEAMALVRADEEVRDRIGTPIEDALFYEGTWNINDGRETAMLEIPVEGPGGAGVLVVSAAVEGDTWMLHSARFVDPVLDDHVDLLARAAAEELGHQEDVIGDIYAEAGARARAGDVAGALARYDQVVELDPTHAEARLARGKLHHEQGDPEAAMGDLEMAAGREETYEEAWREIGEIHLAQEQWDECVDAFTRVLQKYADDGVAWYGRSRCYEGLQDLRRARAGAREACNLGVGDACSMADRL